MTITRAITVSNRFDIGSLQEALLAASIPVERIRSTFSANSEIAVDYTDASTAQQRGADTDAVITRFDRNVPLSYVNVKQTGAVLIAVINGAAKRFLPVRVRIVCVAATSLSAPASLSIGTNGPNYDNIQAITAMTTLTALGRIRNEPMFPTVQGVLTRVAVYCNVTTAATGTSGIYRIDLIGDYEPVNGNGV